MACRADQKGIKDSIAKRLNLRQPYPKLLNKTPWYPFGFCHELGQKRSYPDQFEEKYGYLRTEVMKAVYSFLDCGIPENGMARVRCEECGHDFFVAYSCRCRVVCPSCSTKRSILHALVPAGIMKDGVFYEQRNIK